MSDSEFPHAPGCFASALTYKSDAPECQTCAFAAACGPRSETKLAELRLKFGIAAPEKKREVSDKGFTVPVKTAALLQRIARLGVNVAALVEAINPFTETGPPFMALTCHLLIRFPMGITRRQLEQAMELKLGWTRETAASHALQAVQALVALAAADEIDGRIFRRTNND